MADKPVVQVEVHGQKYPIRTELDPRYVEELAQFVESRMALASKSSPSSDAVGLAILTAMSGCQFRTCCNSWSVAPKKPPILAPMREASDI